METDLRWAILVRMPSETPVMADPTGTRGEDLHSTALEVVVVVRMMVGLQEATDTPLTEAVMTEAAAAAAVVIGMGAGAVGIGTAVAVKSIMKTEEDASSC